MFQTTNQLPSGKRLRNYGKIHHLLWVNPLYMAIFNSYVNLSEIIDYLIIECPYAPWCWYIYLHNWVIYVWQMLVNIPAPWGILNIQGIKLNDICEKNKHMILNEHDDDYRANKSMKNENYMFFLILWLEEMVLVMTTDMMTMTWWLGIWWLTTNYGKFAKTKLDPWRFAGAVVLMINGIDTQWFESQVSFKNIIHLYIFINLAYRYTTTLKASTWSEQFRI